MSLADCIDRSRLAGEMTLEEAEALKKRYKALLKQVFSKDEAKRQLAGEIQAEAFERKRRALLTEGRRQELDQLIVAHRNRNGEQDPAQALQYLISHHGEAKVQDIDHRMQTILAGVHIKMEAVLDKFRKGVLSGDLRRRGGQVKADLENVVRELFGESTGDARAGELAKAWSEVAEDLRGRFNNAGGAIGKLEKWGLPQHHNQEALLNFGRDKWVDYVMPLLDREKMRNPLTKQALGDDDLRDSLRGVWDTITSEGWMDREASGQAFGRGALFKRHGDSRYLIFRNADSWTKYQKDFGQPDPFAAMMGHMSSMARDIAFMEVLGPNPGAMMNYLRQRVMKMASTVKPRSSVIDEKMGQLGRLSDELSGTADAKAQILERIGKIHKELDLIRRKVRGTPNRRQATRLGVLRGDLFAHEQQLNNLVPGGSTTQRGAQIQMEMRTLLDELNDLEHIPFPKDNAADHAKRSISQADSMWEIMRGNSSVPVNSRIANVLQGARNIITASTLGSATISAMSDVSFGAMARNFNGIPANKTVQEIVRMFRKAPRREAVRSGLILDSAMNVLHSESRYAGSLNSQTWTGYVADRVLSMSGLMAWTQAAKHAFGMAFQAELADRVGMTLAELPEALLRTLDRHGITSADWDIMRGATLYEPRTGATFLRPNEIQTHAGRAVAEKYLAMILRETKFAVPEGTVASRVALGAAIKPGTLVGELSRNFAQFKSFASAVIVLNGGRVAREVGAGRGARGASYAGAVLISGGILGGAVLQLKEIIAGRDPRDVTKAEFWGAAIMQGGGLGIYGDFLFTDTNRFGGGLTNTVAGPLMDRVTKLHQLTIGNLQQLAQGENTNFGRDLVKNIKAWGPGSNLWYTKLAWERMVMDQIQHLVDPDARKSFRSKMQFRERGFGNKYWWRPGETAPRRAPDASSAIGGK